MATLEWVDWLNQRRLKGRQDESIAIAKSLLTMGIELNSVKQATYLGSTRLEKILTAWIAALLRSRKQIMRPRPHNRSGRLFED